MPRRELAALDATGLLGITVPRAVTAAADLPAAVLAEVVRVIAAVDPAIAQVPQSHYLFVDVLACSARRRRGSACSSRCSPAPGWVTGWPSAAARTPRT